MGLFQNSVLNKYLKGQNDSIVKNAYLKFKAYFQNTERQTIIRDTKEEQFQEGFLRELFVSILGYTLKPDPKSNLTTEFKNEKGSKKADGAVLNNGKALAVIELKGTDTKDLDKINEQAFNYKSNHTNCIYVITSNFEKLRFFIHNAVEHIEFNLFTLTEEEFKILWLCLQVDNLLGGIPLKVKEESIQVEDNITKQLYKDYSTFKNNLWQNIVKNSPEKSQLLLFKKTQKLLDRFLFVLFAEDSGLLPPNSIRRMVDRFEVLKKEDAYKPLYEIFKQYFGYINIGRKGQTAQDDIFAYNGGLFEADEILDNISIDDEVLKHHILQMTTYNFQSEVDVNILGHIFENSLNEIENVTAELEGQDVDKSKSKRKKDGVFYTPKYITKYIVENTVGKLCKEKKAELEIIDEEYAKGRKSRKKETINKLNDSLKAYRDWLLNITICDPACGSGAFLNQALEFLINEHTYLDELLAQLMGASIVFPGIEKHILENNIFGVDINDESIEIARLSLWLRTAQRGRKLTSLNHNIKCGNSLIDNPEVAGNKAFNWQQEFPKIFEKGGFDVVVGNPPYVRQELLGDYKDYFSKSYKVFNFSSDLFAYFYEKGFSLLKQNGLFAFISNTFDKTTAGIDLRKFLKSNTKFSNLIDFTEIQIFEGATTYPIILIAENNNLELQENSFSYTKIPSNANARGLDIDFFNKTRVKQNSLDDANWTFKSSESNIVLAKIQKHKSIREKFDKCYYGVKTALNEAFIIQTSLTDEHTKLIYEGKELDKWTTQPAEQKLILFKSKWTKEKYGSDITELQAIENLKRDYPKHFEILLPFEEQGKKRYDKGDFWWELRNCAYYDLFDKPKIIFPNLQNKNKFCFDDKGTFVNAPAVFLPTDSKALLAILNSRLVWYYLASICVVRSGGYIEVKPQYFEQIPIPDIDLSSTHPLTPKADEIIELTKQQQEINAKFIRFISSKFISININRKLENWFMLSFSDFSKELLTQKIKLPISEQEEWLTYFEEKKKNQNELQTQIKKREKEIDKMVYELYELTDEEIKIIESE